MVLSQNRARNLLINGNFNHLDSRWNEVNGLVALVADVAPGSFGVLHSYNDEDECRLDNQFQALFIKKGKIQTALEQKLSPVFDELGE
ncbi:Imm7 family immunity protein [Yoonia sp. SDW83-1]|uniref:Imm7 family immunity protein n=1 Tax=Yoonia sp. SDW83-1 TaxID=3366945 RepID=UPI00398C718A